MRILEIILALAGSIGWIVWAWEVSHQVDRSLGLGAWFAISFLLLKMWSDTWEQWEKQDRD